MTAQLMVAETFGNQVTEEGKKSQEQRQPSKVTSVETVILSDALRSVIIIFYELELLNRIFLCRLLGTWGTFLIPLT